MLTLYSDYILSKTKYSNQTDPVPVPRTKYIFRYIRNVSYGEMPSIIQRESNVEINEDSEQANSMSSQNHKEEEDDDEILQELQLNLEDTLEVLERGMEQSDDDEFSQANLENTLEVIERGMLQSDQDESLQLNLEDTLEVIERGMLQSDDDEFSQANLENTLEVIERGMLQSDQDESLQLNLENTLEVIERGMKQSDEETEDTSSQTNKQSINNVLNDIEKFLNDEDKDNILKISNKESKPEISRKIGVESMNAGGDGICTFEFNSCNDGLFNVPESSVPLVPHYQEAIKNCQNWTSSVNDTAAFDSTCDYRVNTIKSTPLSNKQTANNDTLDSNESCGDYEYKSFGGNDQENAPLVPSNDHEDSLNEKLKNLLIKFSEFHIDPNLTIINDSQRKNKYRLPSKYENNIPRINRNELIKRKYRYKSVFKNDYHKPNKKAHCIDNLSDSFSPAKMNLSSQTDVYNVYKHFPGLNNSSNICSKTSRKVTPYVFNARKSLRSMSKNQHRTIPSLYNKLPEIKEASPVSSTPTSPDVCIQLNSSTNQCKNHLAGAENHNMKIEQNDIIPVEIDRTTISLQSSVINHNNNTEAGEPINVAKHSPLNLLKTLKLTSLTKHSEKNNNSKLSNSGKEEKTQNTTSSENMKLTSLTQHYEKSNNSKLSNPGKHEKTISSENTTTNTSSQSCKYYSTDDFDSTFDITPNNEVNDATQMPQKTPYSQLSLGRKLARTITLRRVNLPSWNRSLLRKTLRRTPQPAEKCHPLNSTIRRPLPAVDEDSSPVPQKTADTTENPGLVKTLKRRLTRVFSRRRFATKEQPEQPPVESSQAQGDNSLNTHPAKEADPPRVNPSKKLARKASLWRRLTMRKYRNPRVNATREDSNMDTLNDLVDKVNNAQADSPTHKTPESSPNFKLPSTPLNPIPQETGDTVFYTPISQVPFRSAYCSSLPRNLPAPSRSFLGEHTHTFIPMIIDGVDPITLNFGGKVNIHSSTSEILTMRRQDGRLLSTEELLFIQKVRRRRIDDT